MILNNISRNVLSEQRGFSPPKNPPKNIQSILGKIKLFEIYPNIFAVVIKDDKLRARVFMRYQEFYESDSDTFRGKGFKWKDYVKFYKQKTKKDYFSYHEDWSGYNLPCDSIESCIAKIPDINFYDLIMFSIIDTIRDKVGDKDFYLIGIDQNDNNNSDLILHELAHGLWYSDKSYKQRQMSNILSLDENTRDYLAKKVSDMGYGENVINDEIQAYLSTGIDSSMSRIKGIKQSQIAFKSVFDDYSKKIKANEIPIDWSTDLNA